ncbi:MAG TPA: YncE family protein [Trebonia sp.]
MSTDNGMPKRGTLRRVVPPARRRVTIAVSAATAGAVAVVGGLAVTGTFSSAPAATGAAATSSVASGQTRHATLTRALRAIARTAGSGASYDAYIAAETGSEVVQVNVTAGTIAGTISADSVEGVAVSPNGATAYLAETGQYYVIADELATKKQTQIEVGAYPQDIAVSPSGRVVYATVTGGDTGAGGSDVVAAIDPATDKVAADIKVGPAPRQVVFGPDGATAYVTTETGIYEISTATNRVIKVIPGADGTNGPQGIAVSPDGATLYVTNPDAGTVAAIDAATGRVIATATGQAEPYGVAVTPNGSALYVTDQNSDSVSVLSAATLKVTATVSVGRLPEAVTVSPDGSQVWVGNGYTGDVSVISTATNSVVATLDQGTGTSNLDAAITDIVFAPAT